MVRISLLNKRWQRAGGTYARGYAHLGGSYLEAQGLAQVLDACVSTRLFQERIGQLNGCFAVVSQRDGKLLIAADRLRTIPLFYAARDSEHLVSDAAAEVLTWVGRTELNPEADIEFRLTGYVTGRETLYANIFQVEAGELVDIDAARSTAVERYRYHQFHHDQFLDISEPDLVSRLVDVHAAVFQRLVDGAGDRTIVVPLSGGYDSRLIVVSLRDLGVRNVICYSYGVPGNWESRISQELARYLGFRWEFIPYSADRWRAWAELDSFRAYFHAAGNLCSVPHIQDWPAVLELQNGGRIPMGSIFVPGHSGDFLAGSHIPKWYVRRRSIHLSEFLDSLFQAHYSLWDWPKPGERKLHDMFQQRVESVIGPIQSCCSPELAADLFERWDLQERQAKFICNSVRVYESFGYDWRLPLFDYDLMSFWERIPIQGRTGRRLYFDFVRQRQALPVTDANKDHNALVSAALEAIDAMCLRSTAKRLQRIARRILWRRQYEGSAMAWFSIFDPELFCRTYTGKELFYSYLAARYRDLVVVE